MNRDETKQAIAVMQGWVDGKEIEWRIRGSESRWCNYFSNRDEPVWNWYASEYRIRPEPREFWLNTMTHEVHDYKSVHRTTSEWVRVREVLDEMSDFRSIENKLATGPATDDEPFDEYQSDPDRAYDNYRDGLMDTARGQDLRAMWERETKK